MLHGHALLSRHPLEGGEDRRFARRLCHDKGFVVATVQSPALGDRAIDVVSVHLEPFAPGVRRSQILELAAALGNRAIDVVSVHLEPFAPGVRRSQILELAAALGVRRAQTGRPLVVMGDMNTGYGDATKGVGLLAAELGLKAWRPEEKLPTYSTALPLVRFDWVQRGQETGSGLTSERALRPWPRTAAE